MANHPADIPPPGAPVHWAHMSWRARQRWVARNLRDVSAARPRDEKGRLIWTEDEQRAANNANWHWKNGTGPELTDEQRDAHRAYLRTKDERARRERGQSRRGNERSRRTQEITDYVQATTGTLDPRQIAGDLGITPNAVAMALERAERRDLAAPFRALRNADKRAQRAQRAREIEARLADHPCTEAGTGTGGEA